MAVCSSTVSALFSHGISTNQVTQKCNINHYSCSMTAVPQRSVFLLVDDRSIPTSLFSGLQEPCPPSYNSLSTVHPSFYPSLRTVLNRVWAPRQNGSRSPSCNEGCVLSFPCLLAPPAAVILLSPYGQSPRAIDWMPMPTHGAPCAGTTHTRFSMPLDSRVSLPPPVLPSTARACPPSPPQKLGYITPPLPTSLPKSPQRRTNSYSLYTVSLLARSLKCRTKASSLSSPASRGLAR